ncbi:IS200/IS605 family transposase [Microcoleus sp. AT3-D2]|uniref:IS200/IS605 family transposase n=1 Tax=Microcoleus sp. AT3-D2 TaxID=2818612 RepID=UPI002FD35D13
MTTTYRRERHSVTELKIHLVCITKYRRSVFTGESLDLIEKSFREVAEKMNFQVLEFNGEGDHVKAVITPHFREGLTVLDGSGQFLNSSVILIRENSKRVILIYESSHEKNQAIHKDIVTYKRTFLQ